MRRRNSLESRLCLLVVGLLFALLLAVGHVQMTGQRTALIEARTEKYESLSKMLALVYTPAAGEDDFALYREFTKRFMGTDGDITYVVITDSADHVLFAETREVEPYRYQNMIGKHAGRFMDLIALMGVSSREPIRISIPTTVRDGERGQITIAFGSRSLDAATEAMETRLLATFAMALIVGLLGAVLLAKTIATPLKQLINAARSVEAGNLDVRVPITSHDELGELSDSFNRMVVALRESRDKLVERANTDSLTGLYNHRHFQERLRSELRRAERYRRPLSMIMLDIDHFKTLNDTHGHPVGDAVLHEVAQTLASEARRDIDILTRYGGEEFAIILPEIEAAEAISVAERIRQTIQRHSFLGKDGEPVPVTVSLGVAQYPVHSSEPEGLIMAADLAMYQSKSMGRNRVTLFSTDTRNDKTNDPYRLYLLLHATDMGTIEAMAAAVDAKGQRSPGFSKAVMQHSLAVADELGLSETEMEDVRIASLLHDIGKLAVSESILIKDEPLSEEEYAIVRSHPSLGYSVVQKSPHLKSMLPGILYHHERWDGTGYPSGLRGKQIPMVARIIAVVDSYHAMITQRPHSEPRSPIEASREIMNCAGTQFDPSVVAAFVKVLEREADSDLAAA